MSSIDNKPCCAWKDQFNEPTLDQIRTNLAESDLQLFDAFHARMMELDGLLTRFQWHGDGWHWVIEFCRDDDSSPVAVLIPAEEDIRVAVPIEQEFIKRISVTRLKRSIRDGLELAIDPFDANWAVWSLQPGSFVEDLVHLIKRKLRFLTGRTSSTA